MAVNPAFFDEDYFTKGNKSNYKDMKMHDLISKSYQEASLVMKMTDEKPGKTLVVGCATGMLVKALSMREVDCFGQDISQWAIAQAPEEIKHKLKCFSAHELINNYQADEFNTTVAMDVLEHIPEPELSDAIRQIGLITKEWLVLHMPVWHNDKEPDQSSWSTDKSHVSIYTPEWWENKFTACGFSLHFRTISANNCTFVFTKKPRQQKEILWIGPPYDQSGYGEASRGYLKGLHNIGESVILRSKRFWQGPAVDLGASFTEVLQKMESRHQPYHNYYTVNHLTPNVYMYSENTEKIFSYTPFETNSVPLNWVIPMKAQDKVFVPTDFNVKTYAPFGIKTAIVPHGVDFDLFNTQGRKMSFGNYTDYYKFGANFDWTERKNPKATLWGYWGAGFKPEDKVVLVLKCFFNFPIHQSRNIIKEKIAKEKEKAKEKYGYLPPIVLLDNIVPTQYMPDFYRGIDCFICTSAGEGWGLPLSEAMACNTPVITTLTGNTFCTENNSYIIKGEWEWIPHNSPIHEQSPNYKYQKWLQADVEHTSYLMNYVYNNKEESRVKADNAKLAISKYTWENAAKIMVEEMHNA